MLNEVLNKMWLKAMEHNHRNIMMLMDYDNTAKFLDLGCDDGMVTVKLSQAIGTLDIHGLDINDAKFMEAKNKGVTCFQGDITKGLPFDDNTFDVVLANQVIEHVSNIDIFISEIFRILRKNGYAVISTENGSSWSNIIAAIFGWQIFSLTNVSSLGSGVGNPLAIHRGERGNVSSWTHKTIFNYRGLKEVFELHRFTIEKIMGAGYFPLPSFIANIDPRHGHFITIKARKR